VLEPFAIPSVSRHFATTRFTLAPRPNAGKRGNPRGELQSPMRRGVVPIFGRSVNLIQVVRSEKGTRPPDFAVLLGNPAESTKKTFEIDSIQDA